MAADVVRIVLQPGQRLEVEYAQAAKDVAPEALSVANVAKRFATTTEVVRRMIRRGELAAKFAGRGYVVRIADAERAFAPTLRSNAAPANDDSDEAIEARLRARGVRIGGRR